MKMCSLQKLILLLFVLISGIAKAQQQNETVSTPWDLNPRKYVYSPSAQSWDFIRYGDTPVDLYTGTARADIPVYTYSDADFTIPVSLSFTSGGFMPAQQTGIVGLNWCLNAGGVITREIRGIDDFYGDTPESHTRGFFGGSPFSDTDILSGNTVVNLTDMAAINAREVQSDIYHFSFLGHSGTFHFDGQRRCCVYDTGGNNGTYRITADYNNEQVEFVIATSDGYEYTFGSHDAGDESYNERILNGGFRDATCRFYYNRTNEHLGPMVSWMLRQIKAPNGRLVQFTYADGDILGDNNSLMPLDNTDVLPFSGRSDYPNYIVTFSPDMYTISGVHGGDFYKCPHILKTTYLSSIEIDSKVRIDFKYVSKEGPEVLTGAEDHDYKPYDKIVRALLRLNRIDVKDLVRNTRLGAADLTYKTVSRRPLLKSVKVFGRGLYTMEYHGDTSFPDLLSNGVDFWGYANGRVLADNTALAGTQTTVGTYDEYAQKGSCKLPDAKFSLCGNLKRLTYPTGGWTEFEYEGHEVEYAVLRHFNRGLIIGPPAEWPDDRSSKLTSDLGVSSSYMPSLHYFGTLRTPDKHAGGVRIRTITDDDGQGCRTTRLFGYTDARGVSTGNLLRFPRYIAETFATPVGKESNLLMMHLNSVRNTFDRSHVEYAQVTETRSDRSKIVYNFTNYRNMPDDFSGQDQYVHNYGKNIIIQDEDFENGILRDPNSRQSRRGTLISKDLYDAAGNRVRREEYTYQTHNMGDVPDYSAYVVSSGSLNWTAKLYTGDYRLVGQRTIDSLPSGKRIVETRYGYNDLGQPSLTTTCDGIDTLSKLIRYIPDLPAASRTAAECAMYDSHRYAPVESQQLRRLDRKDKIVAQSRCIYGLFGTTPQPQSIRSASISSPQTSVPLAYYRTDISYDAYDNLGNVLQTTDPSGLTIGYVWGYGGHYLLARVDNATIAALQACGLPGPGEAPLTGALSPVQEERLRALPDVLVTTYDHIPNIGVSRVTDPAGRTSRYQYDNFGRLMRSLDPDDNPTVEFNHHILYF